MADSPVEARRKILKSIASSGKAADKADVDLSSRLEGYLKSGTQTGVEQASNLGGIVFKGLSLLNRPSQAVLRGVQAQQTGTDISDAMLSGLTDVSGTKDINLRAALNTDNFQNGKGFISDDAQRAAANQGGRAAGLIDTIGVAATDPLSYVTFGGGAAARVGGKIAADVLPSSAARKLAEKGLKALNPEEAATLQRGLMDYGGEGSEKFAERSLKALQQPQGVRFAGKTVIPTAKASKLAEDALKSTQVGRNVAEGAAKFVDKMSPSGALRRAGELTKQGASRALRVARAEPNILRSEVEGGFRQALKGGSINDSAKQIINGALHTGQVDEAIAQLEQAGDKTAANTLRHIADVRETLTNKQIEKGTAKAEQMQNTSTYDPRVITTEGREFLASNPNIAKNVFGGVYGATNLNSTKGVSARTFAPEASLDEANRAFAELNPAFEGKLFEDDPVKRWMTKTEQVARDVEAATRLSELAKIKTGGQGGEQLSLIVDGFDLAKAKGAKKDITRARNVLTAETKKHDRRLKTAQAQLKATQRSKKELERVRQGLLKEGLTQAFSRDAKRIGDKRKGKADVASRQSTTVAARLASKKAADITRRQSTIDAEIDKFQNRLYQIEREAPTDVNSRYYKAVVKAETAAQKEYEQGLINKGYTKIEGTGSQGDKWALGDVAKYLEELNAASTPENVDKASRMIQQWTQLWKGYATVPVLFGAGFHTRNAVGNIWNMFVHGFNDPRYFATAQSNVRIVNKAFKNGKSVTEAIDASDLSTSQKKALHAAIKEGITDSTYFHSDFAKHAPESSIKKRAKTAANVFSTDNAAIRSGRALGSFIEDTSRLAMFLSEYEKTGSAAQAARRTKEALFDYADLSATDQTIKKYVPFWTFASRNVPAQIRGLAENPARGLIPAKVQAQQNATDDGDTTVLPGYSTLAGQRKVGSVGGNTLLAGIQLPQQAALQQFAPIADLLGAKPDEGRVRAASQDLGQNFGGGPLALLRAFNENASGSSTFSGAPIKTEGDATRNILTALNPLIGKGNTTVKGALDPDKRVSTALSALGVSNTLVTDSKQQSELYRRSEVLKEYNKSKGVKPATTGGRKKKSTSSLKSTSFPKP